MSKKSSSQVTIPTRMVVVIVILFIILGAILGFDTAARLAANLFGIDLPTPTVEIDLAPDTGSEGGVTEPAGPYYVTFFTDPVIPFDDVTTGGIDQYLVQMIDEAQVSIDAAMFEFNRQNIADALIAAHRRGVRVRVVYDNEHTEDDPHIEELLNAGIMGTPDERSALMHNKFYVFDGQMVWTGSTNITENGFYRNNNNVIVIRSSRLAANYTAEFEEMLNGQFGPTSPANTPNPIFTLNGVMIENYFSPEDDPLPKLIHMVEQAQYSVRFMAFSYTDYDLALAMMQRAEQGVEVSGIFESRGANTEYSECPTLLNAGLDVRLDNNPRTFHHKVIIVDDSVVAIGSFNFSTNASTSNDENLIIIHDPNVAADYLNEFYRRFDESNLPVGGQCLKD